MERKSAEYLQIFAAENSLQQLNLLQKYAQRMPDIKITGTFLEGKALLHALENGARPDALILNLCLLDMDALEFLDRFQALPAAYDLKILITSGGRNQSVHEKLLSLGADYYMIKPYRMETLFERVRMICWDGLTAGITLEDLIDARLKQLGIWPGEAQGYMQRAVYKMVMANHQVRLVEDIYGAIAQETGVSLGTVDASLRRTLKETERIGTLEYRRLVQMRRDQSKKITVGTFLRAVSGQIRREYRMLNPDKKPGREIPPEKVE